MRTRNIRLHVIFDLTERKSLSFYDEWATERQGLTIEEIDEISQEQVARKNFKHSLTNKKTT